MFFQLSTLRCCVAATIVDQEEVTPVTKLESDSAPFINYAKAIRHTALTHEFYVVRTALFEFDRVLLFLQDCQ